jgi:hypothetical protein
MIRVLEIKMFPNMGAMGRPLSYEILGRIRRHLVGRVVTLAAATAFNAILSVALLPLATRQLMTAGITMLFVVGRRSISDWRAKFALFSGHLQESGLPFISAADRKD